MASKALLLLGLFVVLLLIASEAAARDVAETSHTSAVNSKETKLEDASKASKTQTKVDQVDGDGSGPSYGGGPGGDSGPSYGGGPGGDSGPSYGGGPEGNPTYGDGPGYGGSPGGGYKP